MIIGLVITAFAIVVVLYQVYMVERIQCDILSIYAHL